MYETFRWGPNGVLWSQCDVPSHHHVLQMMLKGDFALVRSIDVSQINGTLKFEFLHEFSENFKRNWHGMVQTSFGM